MLTFTIYPVYCIKFNYFYSVKNYQGFIKIPRLKNLYYDIILLENINLIPELKGV